MSSEEWKRVQLGDILTLHYGKALVAHKRNPGLIPVYSSSGITGWHNKPLINDKGIIIGRKGNVGSVFYSNTPFYCIDTAYYVTPNDTDLDFLFLYYLLQTLGLKALNEDSAVPGLNRETALAQWVDVPADKNLQSLIANQIAIFDDKIELNRQTNATLEAIAQAIFKEWFVDFNYPGASGEMVESELGPIPKGWRVVQLGDITDLSWGDTKTTKNSYVNDGYLAYSASGPDGFLPYYDFSRDGIVISAIGAYSGKTWFAHDKWSCIKNTIRFWSIDQNVSNEYLFLLTSSQGFWPLRGSAQPFISQTDARNKKVLYPKDQPASQFGSLLRPLFYTIYQNLLENVTLAKVRDLLLPELLDGAIDL